MTTPQLLLALLLFGSAGALVIGSRSLDLRGGGTGRVEGGVWFWVAVLCFFGLSVVASHWQEPSSSRPSINEPVYGSPPPGGVYYENPAPGDDGSYDCPPGGGPIYVGDSDPAGLDGDGDGLGCE